MDIAFPLRMVAGTLFATAICTSSSFAAKSQTAKLTLAENKVTVAGQPKPLGSTIAPGETIVTGSRSRAEVMLPDGTVVRIGQGSSFSFDGSKLTLSQGSALFNLTGKNSKIVTPALTRTGSPGVVSVHASHNYNALFDLKGSDTVNGSPLVAGQAWVSEGGAVRTFTFDMQKMIGTSTLVTKFPQTPWVAQTTALASVQHQIIAAIKAQPALVSQRPVVTTAANGSTVVTVGRSSGTPGFLSKLASAFSGKPAAGGGTQGGTLQVSAGGLLLNGTKVANSAVTINSAITGSDINRNISGGTLTISAANTYTGATNTYTGVTAINVGTLSVGNGTFATFTGATFTNLTAGGSINLNTNVVDSGATNLAGLVKTGTGTLVLNGAINSLDTTTTLANSVTLPRFNTTTVPTIIPTNGTGTLSVVGAANSTGGAVKVGTGNLVLTNGTLVGGTLNAPTINGTSVSTLVPGQIVNINGTNFTVGTAAGTTGNLLLTPTPAAH